MSPEVLLTFHEGSTAIYKADILNDHSSIAYSPSVATIIDLQSMTIIRVA